MKRYYEATITMVKVIEVDENDIRFLCDIPKDEDVLEEIWNDWAESIVEDYIRDNIGDYNNNDIVELQINEIRKD